MRLARWAAVLVALGGSAALAVREAPPETWAVRSDERRVGTD